MATDRRRAAATATTGAALTAAGGVLRHQGVHAAHQGNIPEFSLRNPVKTHPTRAMLRAGARGRKRYALGATLGLIGAPAFAVGAHDYVTTRKRDDRKSFVREGISGTKDALEQRAAGMKEVPPQHRFGPIAVAAASGAGGSLLAHRAMDKTKYFRGAHRGGRAGLAALAGTAAATASFPLARRTVRSSEYEVTPAGVRRRKKPPVRPSSKGTVFDQKRMSRGDYRRATVGKRYLGEGAWSPTKIRLARGLSPQHQTKIRGINDQMATDAHFGRMQRYNKTSRGILASTREVDPKQGTYRTRIGKVDNPHQLPTRTSRGTPRKVHWKAHEADRAICGTDGAFGQGVGPFAENMGELTCRGCRKKLGVAKADSDYLGRRTSYGTQRAKTMAAGAIPIIPFAGPSAAARQAGRYAPPGGKRKAQARQLASSAATTATGVGGAYLAAGNKRVGAQAMRGHAAMQRATNKVTGPVKSRVKLTAPGGHRLAEAKARGAARATRTIERSSAVRRAVKPLRANKPAAIAGYLAGSKLSGQVWGNLAISRNQAAQRKYNLKHPQKGTTSKAAGDTGMSRREERKLLERKRHSATTQVLTSSLGLAGAGMGVALLPGVRGRLHPRTAEHIQRTAIGTGLAAGGISGVHGIRNARLQHKEIAGRQRALGVTKALAIAARLQELHKADRQPLTRMHADQAHKIVRQYGDAGPLPNSLSRSERMTAYEARYVHAGGHKAERWQHRADLADKFKTAGLAGATAGGAAIMALRHPRVTARLGRRVEHARHAADTATLGAATASGAAELYAGHARRRRSSYSNSKAGVAASALRRMKDYSG